MHISRIAGLTLFGVSLSLTAEASRIMYNGFTAHPDRTPDYFKGFTSEVSALRPDTSTYLVMGTGAEYSLALPTCFADVPSIMPVPGTANGDGALKMSWAATSGNSGAKVLALADNCQARKGELNFRFLIRPSQGALDALGSSGNLNVPARGTTHSCGLIWSVADYTHACVTNTSLRYVKSYVISSEVGDLSGADSDIRFERGFMVGVNKVSSDWGCVIKLFTWGKGATAVSDVKAIELASHISGDTTYICHVRIEIDHYKNGDDRITAFVQPTEGYDPDCGWFGAPLARAIRTDIIGDGAESLKAHLVVQGPNDKANLVLLDEIGLATSAQDLTRANFAKERFGEILAYEGFPCGPAGYPSGETSPQTSVSTNVVVGFGDSYWKLPISKGTPRLRGDGFGLSLPACYDEVGVPSFPGTAFGYSGTPQQGMYMRRAFTSGLLAAKTGDVLNMRFLISANKSALISQLQLGPDNEGGLITGTPGVQGAINYFGAGIADCTVEKCTGESHAPTLCCLSNSCFVTFTRNKDGSVALYLNLLTAAEGTPAAYKIVDVDTANMTDSKTYLCYVRIEVGTGADGKERITAFAEDVTKITDRYAANWIPSEYGEAIEYELISDTAYPKHAIAGGQAHTGFLFDEFGISRGCEMPLIWAKRPSGLLLLFR